MKAKTSESKKPNTVAHVLEFFGFTEVVPPTTKEAQQLALKYADSHMFTKQEALAITSHRVSLLSYAEAHGVQGAQPLLSYSIVYNQAKKEATVLIDIVGIQRGVAEALLMVALGACLTRLGLEACNWNINCIGEKESFAKFTKEITNYFKKNIADIPAAFREKFKESPLSLLTANNSSVEKIALEAPQSINFLSEQSREYFKEILEYIEATECLYEVKNKVLPAFDYESHCLADSSIIDKKHTVIARMARYNNLSKAMQSKRDLPAAGVALTVPMSVLTKNKESTRKQPSFYLVHAGIDARRKALGIMLELEKHGIKVHHGILKDKLSAQMMNAEQLKVEYILLIGQKEYVEQTIIVRNTTNRSEKVVKQSELPAYLKNLKS